jgi:N-acetylglucosamine kinase-like BadF-type ATPase
VTHGGSVASVLAIDGGNSKTDVALIGPDGSVLSTARGGNSNHQGIGRDGTVRVLTELVQAVTAAASLPADGLVARHTSACLAGADLPEEEIELTELIQAQGWTASSEVVNDTFAVLRAGLDDEGEHWGIGVVCGAGTNCVGVAPGGRTTRLLALGQISGDWGGGGDLGPEALWWAARAEDGRGPQTELRAAVPAHFGLATVRDVVIGLYHGKIHYSDLHGLVPVLFAVAGEGDRVASDIVVRQAEEICVMAAAAVRQLGLDGGCPAGPVPVVLGGSLMTARDPLLSGTIATRLADMLPGSNMRIVDVPPVAGAALLGLDHVGAPPAASARLRESAAATW